MSSKSNNGAAYKTLTSSTLSHATCIQDTDVVEHPEYVTTAAAVSKATGTSTRDESHNRCIIHNEVNYNF
jgi:hypothetical protein